MYVIKRDGSREELNISNIRKQTFEACKNLDGVDLESLELDCQILFKDGIKTEEIQQALIQTAIDKVNIDTPNWTYVAARLSLYNLYHKIKHLYSAQGSGNVYEKVHLKSYIKKNKSILSEWYLKYTDEDIEYFNSLIDSQRDLLFDYTGFELLKGMYLARLNGEISELPQHLHMGVAMFNMQNEEPSKRREYVKEYYEATSKLKFINATPINANGRLLSNGLISCMLLSVEDSLDSITDKMKEASLASKIGSGLGIDVTKIRSIGSDINIHKNAAGGKIPFLKIFNDIAIAVDQSR